MKPICHLYIAVLVLIVFFTAFDTGFSASLVEFSDDKLTVSAKNESLIRLLEQVAKKTNVVIFISKEFNPGPLTIQLDKVPLEQAFKKLLKQYDFATIYNKIDDDFTISALKVYPKGKTSGEMDVLISRSIPSEETRQDLTGSSKPIVPGTSLPGKYVAYVSKKDQSLIPAAHGFEITEEEISKEINELRQTIRQTNNTVEKDMLTLELMNRLAAFEDMQRKHSDTLESLYRAALLKRKQLNHDD
jgi:hypothetical protein